ncbi:MAG: hypothetical protein HYX78_00675 [Armatimonadetes bacterium]|nr:hypothetical protein [Armatimonadota bacterium]
MGPLAFVHAKKTVELLIGLMLLFVLAASCSAQPTASTDIVPSGDWTYDALMHLAARGLIPGVAAQRFMGDWRYGREEMAEFVRQALQSEVEREKDWALLFRLITEFRPELILLGYNPDELASPELHKRRSVLIPVAALDPRLERQHGETNLIGVYDTTALAPFGRYGLAVATLSNLRRKFDGGEFSRLEKFSVRSKTPNWEWEIGRDWLWWGPAYSGSLALSDNSPAFDMLRLGKDFYLGRHIGNVKINQFISRFGDGSDHFYLIGRRIEKRLSKRLHLGINETAKTSKTPNPLVLVLPLYVYEQIYLEDVDAEWNAFLGIDMLYKFSQRFEGYFDLLIDDINAPPLLRESGENFHRPRKIGFLLGGHWPDICHDGTTDFRAEFILTDSGTYGATRPDFPGLAYTHEGRIIGHPLGPNSEALFLRLDRKIGEDWRAVAEYLGRRPDEGDGPNLENTHRLSLLVVRDLAPRTSLTARYDSLRLPAKVSRFQIGASYVF